MPQRIAPALAAVLLLVVVGCASSSTTPSPSAAATVTPTVAPTVAPTATAAPSQSSASGDPFADQPYVIDLPAGWQAVDPSALGGSGLDAFSQANPGLAGAIEAFKSTPNVRLATNLLLGNAIVALAISSQGLSLDTIGQSLTAQFQNVPGVINKPTAEPVTLPGGKALHWPISLSANKVGGGSAKVNESVYLLADDKNALIVEFVTPSGGASPDEAAIIKSVRFK
jgi:hypothetical protein